MTSTHRHTRARGPPACRCLSLSLLPLKESMSYFMVDDQLPVNPKVKQLAARTLAGSAEHRLEGLAALGMWTLAGASTQASMTDGRVSIVDLIGFMYDKELALRLAGLLVEVGLWHTAQHDCSRCPQVGSLEWVFHDWADLKYDSGEMTRLKRAKSRELKDAKIVNAVWLRDCADYPHATKGKCRYCGTMLNRQTRRGDTRPHLDHVNPNVYEGARNIVLACRPCNQSKYNKTPEQAGMTLLPPPSRVRPSQVIAEPPQVAPAGRGSRTVEDTAPGRGEHRVAAAPAPDITSVGDSPPDQVPDQTPDQTDIRPDQTPDQIDIKPDQAPDQASESVLACARGRTRAGQGEDGLSPGLPTGSPEGDGQGGRRGKRRRGRRRPPSDGPPAPSLTEDLRPASRTPGERLVSPGHDAGDAPIPLGSGRFGSPYYGWRGQPSEVDETDCPDHGLPEPCQRCMKGASNE